MIFCRVTVSIENQSRHYRMPFDVVPKTDDPFGQQAVMFRFTNMVRIAIVYINYM